MKKQKVFTIVYISLMAASLLAFMGFFFLQMRKTPLATLFINYWLIFLLASSNILVFFYQLKRIFGKQSAEQPESKQFFALHTEQLIAWIVILFLLVAASMLCWHDYFTQIFLPQYATATAGMRTFIKLFLPTIAPILLLSILVLPQSIFLLQQTIQKIKNSKK